MPKELQNENDKLIFTTLINLLASLGVIRDDSKLTDRMNNPYAIMIRKSGDPNPIYSVYDLCAMVAQEFSDVTQKQGYVMEALMFCARTMQEHNNDQLVEKHLDALQKSLRMSALIEVLSSALDEDE